MKFSTIFLTIKIMNANRIFKDYTKLKKILPLQSFKNYIPFTPTWPYPGKTAKSGIFLTSPSSGWMSFTKGAIFPIRILKGLHVFFHFHSCKCQGFIHTELGVVIILSRGAGVLSNDVRKVLNHRTGLSSSLIWIMLPISCQGLPFS